MNFLNAGIYKDLGQDESLQEIGPKLAILWRGFAVDSLDSFRVAQGQWTLSKFKDLSSNPGSAALKLSDLTHIINFTSKAGLYNISPPRLLCMRADSTQQEGSTKSDFSTVMLLLVEARTGMTQTVQWGSAKK